MNDLRTKNYTLSVKAGEMPIPVETLRDTSYLVIPQDAEFYEVEVISLASSSGRHNLVLLSARMLRVHAGVHGQTC